MLSQLALMNVVLVVVIAACHDGCSKCDYVKTTILCNKCNSGFDALIKADSDGHWMEPIETEDKWELCVRECACVLRHTSTLCS